MFNSLFFMFMFKLFFNIIFPRFISNLLLFISLHTDEAIYFKSARSMSTLMIPYTILIRISFGGCWWFVWQHWKLNIQKKEKMLDSRSDEFSSIHYSLWRRQIVWHCMAELSWRCYHLSPLEDDRNLLNSYMVESESENKKNDYQNIYKEMCLRFSHLFPWTVANMHTEFPSRSKYVVSTPSRSSRGIILCMDVSTFYTVAFIGISCQTSHIHTKKS